MNTNKHTRLLTFVGLLLTAFSSFGQTSDKADNVIFKVTRFDPNDRPSPTFFLGGKNSKEEVTVPLTHLEGPFKQTLGEGGFLNFWRGDEEKPEISVKINPSERKNLLLVFVPQKESFSVLKINMGNGKFKGGDRFIVNVTKKDIAIRMGNMKPLYVKSLKKGILRAPSKGSLFPVLIKQRQSKEWALVGTEDWHIDRRFRKILFIYRSPKNRGILFHGVSERLR